MAQASQVEAGVRADRSARTRTGKVVEITSVASIATAASKFGSSCRRPVIDGRWTEFARRRGLAAERDLMSGAKIAASRPKVKQNRAG